VANRRCCCCRSGSTGGFPKAKALVGTPSAVFEGGSRHTDRYAWGQVAGFDEDAEAFSGGCRRRATEHASLASRSMSLMAVEPIQPPS
jgi:hypothetical protein